MPTSEQAWASADSEFASRETEASDFSAIKRLTHKSELQQNPTPDPKSVSRNCPEFQMDAPKQSRHLPSYFSKVAKLFPARDLLLLVLIVFEIRRADRDEHLSMLDKAP